MARWQNFTVWRGRLPHWRADNVTYYAKFRHRRALTEQERDVLMACLLKPQGRKLDYAILWVGEQETEALFTVHEAPHGSPYELADIIEKAKAKAGKAIIKSSGERFPPLYQESYDRIVRDDQEYEDTWQAVLSRPVESGEAESPEDSCHLYVPNAPSPSDGPPP